MEVTEISCESVQVVTTKKSLHERFSEFQSEVIAQVATTNKSINERFSELPTQRKFRQRNRQRLRRQTAALRRQAAAQAAEAADEHHAQADEWQPFQRQPRRRRRHRARKQCQTEWLGWPCQEWDASNTEERPAIPFNMVAEERPATPSPHVERAADRLATPSPSSSSDWSTAPPTFAATTNRRGGRGRQFLIALAMQKRS